MTKIIAALDQGTTSTRCILFNQAGEIISHCQKEHRQIYPQPGWVEHDPLEILDNSIYVIQEALQKANLGSADLAGLGITNQRETTVLWERATGKPIYNAIVWQCRRTTTICEQLTAEGCGEDFRRRTGLVVDAYFSGTKVKWLLDHIPGARERAARGELCFGTVDSWILFKL
ncbi:MAG: glycerol kinase, partial [Bacteroidetes bacterium]